VAAMAVTVCGFFSYKLIGQLFVYVYAKLAVWNINKNADLTSFMVQIGVYKLEYFACKKA